MQPNDELARQRVRTRSKLTPAAANPTGGRCADRVALQAGMPVIPVTIPQMQPVSQRIGLLLAQSQALPTLNPCGHALQFFGTCRLPPPQTALLLRREDWHGRRGCRLLALRVLTLCSLTLRGVVVVGPQSGTFSATLSVALTGGAARRATPVMGHVVVMGFARRWRGPLLCNDPNFIDFSCNICNTCNTPLELVIFQ
jgi:hypothetical protein